MKQKERKDKRRRRNTYGEFGGQRRECVDVGRRRLAVEGTGTPGRERWRGRAVGWDRGRWAAGVARVETKKKKKKKGRRPKDLFGRRPEERRGFIPVAPARARPRDLDVSQVDNVTSPPVTCVGEAFEGLREGESGEEGARTGRGNGDGVVVARWSRAAHPEPVMAHNLIKTQTAMLWRV